MGKGDRVMTELEYQKAALVTIKPHDSKAIAISDWCLGLSGETAEVIDLFTDHFLSNAQHRLWVIDERMELAKEIGDVLWYTAALCAELEVPFVATFKEIMEEVQIVEGQKVSCVYECLQLACEVGYISENIKHHVMHKEALKTELIQQAVTRIWKYLHLLALTQEFTIELAAQLNIAKLQHRYKPSNGTFDIAASAQRHEQEEKFIDTQIYKELYEQILCKQVMGVKD